MARFVMKFSYIQFLLICLSSGNVVNNDKKEFCAKLNCSDEERKKVCGFREEGEGYRLKLFGSMCDLLKFGCDVPDTEAYGFINLEYCEQALSDNPDLSNNVSTNVIEAKRDCSKHHCPDSQDLNYTCALRQDGNGFRIRLFQNNCHLHKYNCNNNVNFEITDDYLCKDVEVAEMDNEIEVPSPAIDNNAPKNLFIVDGGLLNFNGNPNETIENFFAATHVMELPVKEITGDDLNEETRRMILKKFGPQKVFKPWVTIPKNISTDHNNKPTLGSCYHKCPTKCPDTYAPVCGFPGNIAREPSIMFQNHCYMDVAQCKMSWEDKSSTAESSFYIENPFVFCLGEEMNSMYRFLPLVRTLQHMGRLKKKGHFRYKMQNMRYFNNFLPREPKLMG